MTDNTTDPAEQDTAPAAETAPTEDTTAAHDQDEPDSGNKEAAKYRRRLRDTEAERDNLKARLDTLQRGEVQRLIADRFADPADIWRDGATVDDLIDDHGNIDPSKVDNLAANLLTAHQHWAIPKQVPRGFQSGASVTTHPRKNAFTEAFKPRER